MCAKFVWNAIYDWLNNVVCGNSQLQGFIGHTEIDCSSASSQHVIFYRVTTCWYRRRGLRIAGCCARSPSIARTASVDIFRLYDLRPRTPIVYDAYPDTDRIADTVRSTFPICVRPKGIRFQNEAQRMSGRYSLAEKCGTEARIAFGRMHFGHFIRFWSAIRFTSFFVSQSPWTLQIQKSKLLT